MPRSTYPRAVTSGLVSGQTAEVVDVLNAITPLDAAIEQLRTGWLEFGQLRFDPTAVTLTVTAGAITIANSYHLITSTTTQVLSTINGANQGDIIYLERSGGAGDIIVGSYLLDATGVGVWIIKEATGFNVLASNGAFIKCAFRAYRASTVQAVATGVGTKIQWNGTSFNQNGPTGVAVFDPTTNFRFTPGRAGLYQFDIQVTWASAMDAGGLIAVTLTRSGAGIVLANFFGTGNTDQSCSLSIQDLAGQSDYYEATTYHFNAGSRNIQFGATLTYFSGVLVGDLI